MIYLLSSIDQYQLNDEDIYNNLRDFYFNKIKTHVSYQEQEKKNKKPRRRIQKKKKKYLIVLKE